MHPIQFAKTTGAHFVAAWLATTMLACDSPEPFDYCPESACHADGAIDGPKRDTPLPPDTPSPDTGIPRNPLCGTTGCFPGNWTACGPATFAAPIVKASRAAADASDATDDSTTTADVSADAEADADAADASSSDAPSDDVCRDGSHDGAEDVAIDVEPDASEDAATEPTPDAPEDVAEEPDASMPPINDASTTPDSGSVDAAFDLGAPDVPKIVQACYIKPAGTGVTTECAPVGSGAEGSACNDSHECGATMACVEVDQKSICSTVSCGMTPDCLTGTYYEESPLRANGVTRPDLKIPVCLRADNCTLLEPNMCPEGKACAVVGTEGETTCLVPGSKMVGETCDDAASRCDEGLLCSKFSNQCVKICHVDSGSKDCPTGTCQGGNASLPKGFGICVGQTTDGG